MRGWRGTWTALAALALAGCGETAPRYGEATISSAAPRATLSGTTFGSAAAMELAPGCPGYLDLETPNHVLRVREDVPFDVTVRSDVAPLALAVAHGDEVRCDSDEGSGHTPTLSFDRAGDYQVFVAALREPAALPYEVVVRAAGARAEPIAGPRPGSERMVNVTITSQPSGAMVRGEGGAVLGTTPAMFAVPVAPGQEREERAFTLSLPDHEEVVVRGTLEHAALVLHGQLPSIGPIEIAVSSTEAQPIRDYQSAALAVDVVEACPITRAEVGVDLRHSFVGDLRVVLRPPWGEEVVLQRHAGGSRRNLARTWSSEATEIVTRGRAAPPPLASFVGRSTQGRWTMIVHDDAGADEGTFDRFDLRLVCGGAAPNEPPPLRDPFAPRPPREPATITPPRPPTLADLPNRAEIVRVLGALRPQVEQCGGGQGGSARVIATVTGATGRVTEVSTSGVSDANVQRCVARVVRTAVFRPFRRQSLDVDYTYSLR